MTTLDVTNKPLGRAASEAAFLLRGKNSPNFAPNKAPKNIIKVANLDKIRFSEKKRKEKKYKRYSGYPGGLKYTSAEKLFAKDRREVFKKAVWGMLPKNKLRRIMMKNLVLE